MSVPFPGSSDDMMNTIAALRARVAQLEEALLMFTRHPVVPIKDGDGLPAAVVPLAWLENARAALKDAPQ